MAKKSSRKTFTKKITRGPNKGDTTKFRVAPGGKPYPIKIVKDVGKPSTLRDNSGVDFPSTKKRRKKGK